MIQNGIGPLCTSKLPPPSNTAIVYCLSVFSAQLKIIHSFPKIALIKKVRHQVNGYWLAERLLRQGDFAHSNMSVFFNSAILL